MNDFRPLGGPVRAPEPDAKPDEYERKTVHGIAVWTNKRTGAVQTNNPHPPPVYNPFEHMREILRRAQQEQADDGYPLEFWGSM